MVELAPDTVRDLPALAARHLGPHASMLLAAVSPAVRWAGRGPVDAADAGPRLGGVPLLPPGHAWPTTRAGGPLSFLAQVDVDGHRLAFFYEADGQDGWGTHPDDGQYWRVVAVDPATAVATAAPPGARTFHPRGLRPLAVTTLPDMFEPPVEARCVRDARALALAPGAAEWVLLLQLDTDEEAGWMWGDVGRLYFWIRAADLAAARFDRVWMILQCC